MARRYDTKAKLAGLASLVEGKATMLIALESNPDPDALGSGMALRTLVNGFGVNCSLACSGTIGRAENQALVRYAKPNLRGIDDVNPDRYDLVALVDAQPGQRNNSLPAAVIPDIVIDHHPIQPATRRVRFTDIRSRYGATATILYEYLEAASITPDTPLATALLYGIRSDTQDFSRQTCQADVDAADALHKLASKRMLGAIQRGRAPLTYFRTLATALSNARRCGDSIYSSLGTLHHPDMIAEIADLLLRYEKAESSLCWAHLDGMVRLSVRTLSVEKPANEIVKHVVGREGAGGGHATMAAGQISLGSAKANQQARLDKLIRRRFLEITGCNKARSRRLT